MKEPKGNTGDLLYEVEWCTDMPQDENGDVDFYECTYDQEYLKTQEEAIAFAKKIFPKDLVGEVKIRPGYLELKDPDFPVLGHYLEIDEDAEIECIYESDLSADETQKEGR